MEILISNSVVFIKSGHKKYTKLVWVVSKTCKEIKELEDLC